MAEYFKREFDSLRNSPIALGLGIGILALAILGARLQVPELTMTMIVAICVAIGLVAFKKIKSGYVFLVYITSLALLYQTTLLSNQLIGTDIHSEFYFAKLTKANGFWNWTLPHSYNSAIVPSFILPMMGKFSGIGTLWTFKIVAPIFFAFVPLLLYYVFKSQFGKKIAFFSAMFFVIMPTYSMEMVGITRQQSAELMFAIILVIMIVSKLSLKVKIPAIIGLSVLTVIFHYSLFLIVLAYFGIAVLVLIGFKNRTIPLKWMMITMGVVMAVGIGYFSTVSSGIPIKSMSWLGQSQIYRLAPEMVEEPTSEPLRPTSLPPEINTAYIAQANHPTTFADHESMMQTALGMDMASASASGKSFRIFQVITQVLIVIGTVVIIRKRKNLSPEYFAFCIGSVVIMIMCFAFPGFSAMLNASRFYHIALIFLAPAVILGGMLIFKKYQIIALGILIPYFLLSSGFAFEASKSTITDRIDLPFSTALSYQRVDLGGVFTENDIAVRDYAWDNKLLPIYGDLYGELILEESYGLDGWGQGLMYLPYAHNLFPVSKEDIISKSYIYMRERNMQTETVTFWHGPGLRQSHTFGDYGLVNELASRPIIYQKGDAILYGKRQ